ncbi:MAG TPA: glycosyltransferase [Terracidiphilus sp.]|nr:glycosyltransferase [Terracidiphilus sp.]
MTTELNTADRSRSSTLDAQSSLVRLEQAADVHYPRLLRSVLPQSLKDALRELRGQALAYLAMRQLPRDRVFEQSVEDAEASSVLSIIVPVHDAPEVTERCLKSLERYAPNAEVILVDDGSKLEETRILLKDFAARRGWKLIHNATPLGHSEASRVGASSATKPYLCLLNSDTVVTPWCWRLIVQAFKDDSKIGAAGPSTSHGGMQTIPLAQFARHYLNDSQICAYAQRLLAGSSGPILSDIYAVIGFAFFIKRDIWEQLDGFDRKLPDYGNEIELCKRIQGLGYRVVWVRNAYIHHLAGVSYSKLIGHAAILARHKSAHDYILKKHSMETP